MKSKKEIEKEELLKDEGYILIKEVFCKKLLDREELDISLKEAQELFYSYWIYTSQDKATYSLPGAPKELLEAYIYYRDNIENKDKNSQYLETLLESYLKTGKYE